MPPVERIRPDLCQVDVVEAANVDAELVRVRSRHIEGVNAAMAAECVLGGQRVELVGGELVLAAQQLKMFRRDDEMQKTFFGADRTVALDDVRQVGGDGVSATLSPIIPPRAPCVQTGGWSKTAMPTPEAKTKAE